MKPIAIVQHVANDGPGFFSDYLEECALPYTVLRMDQGASLPRDIAEHAGLCILGGPMSANDPLPYFPRLQTLVRQAIGLDIPVLGHCLGGQIMALALGGTVGASENLEIGWSELRVCSPLGARWFGTLGPLSLFQWHGESFSLPPGAVQLVRGTYCANQAFSFGERHLAMQFHCEVTDAKVRDWLHSGADEIAGANSPGVQTAAQILPTLAQDLARSQATARHIYQCWAQGLARD